MPRTGVQLTGYSQQMNDRQQLVANMHMCKSEDSLCPFRTQLRIAETLSMCWLLWLLWQWSFSNSLLPSNFSAQGWWLSWVMSSVVTILRTFFGSSSALVNAWMTTSWFWLQLVLQIALHLDSIAGLGVSGHVSSMIDRSDGIIGFHSKSFTCTGSFTHQL